MSYKDKFLKPAQNMRPAANDAAVASFTADEENFLTRMVRKHNGTMSKYEENGGARIDIFMTSVEKAFHIMALGLTKHQKPNGEHTYRILLPQEIGGMVMDSLSFGTMQTSLQKILTMRARQAGLQSITP